MIAGSVENMFPQSIALEVNDAGMSPICSGTNDLNVAPYRSLKPGMPNGERVSNSGGAPIVISPETLARSLRVFSEYLSAMSLRQTMTSLSSAVDGVPTTSVAGSAVPSAVICSSTFFAVIVAFGSLSLTT